VRACARACGARACVIVCVVHIMWKRWHRESRALMWARHRPAWKLHSVKAGIWIRLACRAWIMGTCGFVPVCYRRDRVNRYSVVQWYFTLVHSTWLSDASPVHTSAMVRVLIVIRRECNKIHWLALRSGLINFWNAHVRLSCF